MSAADFISEYDLHLLAEGTHYRAYEKLGAHLTRVGGEAGVHFAVQAPNAQRVAVVGDFNHWDPEVHQLRPRGGSGVWAGFLPGVAQGALYKYQISSRDLSHVAAKADPYGFAAEIRPETASKVWDLSTYEWHDGAWMAGRGAKNAANAPISIYELHLGSWRRVSAEANRWLTYRELAPQLADYVTSMGFTHVEFLPVTEHPLDESWGYQTVGYYAPTSRYGTPDDLMFLVDTLHQAGIGVIVDWVPAHFPADAHGLAYFDGTHLYEHDDPRQREHPEWGTRMFNYGRWEVQTFLISNARFWFDRYHIDGFRVDAVASMLYLDYGRRSGGWVPNRYGGRENIEAVDFLRRFNEWVYQEFPDVMTMAEESTAWPMVSRPAYLGGLGFGFKWNMGWMHDMLQYMSTDPVHRSHHQHLVTFSLLYAFSENFLLPLSHDEVVHGKGSMIGKMPGDEWQKFANLRLLYGFMFTHPGKKLLFMGNEIGQWREWSADRSLDWQLLESPLHEGLQHWVRDLNALLREAPAHERDFDADGFEWIDCSDALQSVISFLRFGSDRDTPLLVVCNFTPVVRHEYRIGVPIDGFWQERLNSDAGAYGGSGQGNLGGALATPVAAHGRPYSLCLTLPPLSMSAFRPGFSTGSDRRASLGEHAEERGH